MPSSKVAAVDIGTNSVRLLVADDRGNELVRLMRITRLGQDVDRAGQLHPDAMRRTLRVLDEYGQEIRQAAVQRVRAVATSAARDASNRAEFFEAVQERLGVSPELLAGDDEARLSFRGATESLRGQKPPFLVFDIGGGSTEFAFGHEHPQSFLSTNVGCVRITERFLHADPPSAKELAEAELEVRRWLDRVNEHIPETRTSSQQTWVGLAGTVTSFAALASGLAHYDPTRTHGMRLDRATIQQICHKLWRSGLRERESLLLEPQRAGVIVGGAVVLHAIVEYFALTHIVVSEHDILDGLAASLQPGG